MGNLFDHRIEVDLANDWRACAYRGMSFFEKLAAVMDLRRVSQGDLANATDRSQPQVHKWVSGKTVPTISQAMEMAKFLDVPVNYLIDDRDTRDIAEVIQEMRVRELAEMVGWGEIHRRCVGASPAPPKVELVPPVPNEDSAPGTQRQAVRRKRTS